MHLKTVAPVHGLGICFYLQVDGGTRGESVTREGEESGKTVIRERNVEKNRGKKGKKSSFKGEAQA